MLLTEDQAREKWCPFARVAEPWRFAGHESGQPASVNRGSDGVMASDGVPNCCCIASKCAAWRGQEDARSAEAAEAEFRKSGLRVLVTWVGYCGLAGEP